jgi:polyphosphate kinase
MTPKDKKGKEKKVEKKDRRKETKPTAENPLDDTRLFINREMAWVRFNRRIFEEAQDTTHPLLERVKFLAICGSNLDEFFMVRVSGLRRQLMKGALEVPPDGMTPLEQIMAIRQELQPILEDYCATWFSDILPKLAQNGVHIHVVKDLGPKQRQFVRDHFESAIYPALTPLALDLAHPFPFISNLSINIAVQLVDGQGVERLARVKVPMNLMPRLVQLPNEVMDTDPKSTMVHLVLLEDVIMSNLDMLFPSMVIAGSYAFRITRDADYEIEIDEAEDLLTAIEEGVEQRRIGAPSRLEVQSNMPEKMRQLFANKLGLPNYLVYEESCPLALVDMWQLLGLARPDLKDLPFAGFVPPELVNEKKLLYALEHRDHVLYHPYDNFNTVINLLNQAAVDPDVLAIKITLYRIDKRSPVIDALMEARTNNKQVAALVELKARFDEENNIVWAKMLEQAGVHVVYGLMDLKVHAKMCLIVKRSHKGIVRIAHLSSGNYNSVTSRVYGDIGYITSDPDICSDVQDLFNALTGYSQKEDYKKLLVAPHSLRREMIRRIDREIERHKEKKDGHIAWKLNALLDKEIIMALYRASQAGIKIDLNVRGLCALRPGIKGVSDNIRVTSIVGRFLEHSRIYYFHNGGNSEVLLGSSDMMPRNLNRRVEVLFPVPDPMLRKNIVKMMLEPHLKDNVKSRELLTDGTYRPIIPKEGQKRLSSQQWLIDHRGEWHGEP